MHEMIHLIVMYIVYLHTIEYFRGLFELSLKGSLSISLYSQTETQFFAVDNLGSSSILGFFFYRTTFMDGKVISKCLLKMRN